MTDLPLGSRLAVTARATARRFVTYRVAVALVASVLVTAVVTGPMACTALDARDGAPGVTADR
jgi:hypothetical protein